MGDEENGMNAESSILVALADDANGRILARYMELGEIEKNAKAERDAMKPSIVGDIEAGERFTLGDLYLDLQDKETTTFDWKRAVNDKVISREQAEHYLKRTLSRFPVVKRS